MRGKRHEDSNQKHAYSVKYNYMLMQQDLHQSGSDNNFGVVIKRVWRSVVPSKARAFTWRLLHDRLATKDALIRRGLLD